MRQIANPGLPSRFLYRRTLATGPNSRVIEALDLENGDVPVAIKLMEATGPHAEIARTMFKREVEALKRVVHEGTVKLLDWFAVENGLLGVVLELVEGARTLSQLIQAVRQGKHGSPTLLWRVEMAIRLVNAIQVAHQCGVIHRDLKPQNVLHEPGENLLVLTDYGIARVLELAVRHPSASTVRHYHSRPYASPEQLLQRETGFASDVFGMAMLVATLLGMQEPDEDFTPNQLGDLLAPFVEMAQKRLNVQTEITSLRDTLAKALRDDPMERPSLTTLRSALSALQKRLEKLPQASFQLSKKAREKLGKEGFWSLEAIAKDLNHDLRVDVSHKDGSRRIKLYGQTIFVVIQWDDAGTNGLSIVDAGCNSGPRHAHCRQNAKPCSFEIHIGRGSCVELLEHLESLERQAMVRNTLGILEWAEKIIDLERERLPVVSLSGWIGGEAVRGREWQIGRASGYEGAKTEKVLVSGGLVLNCEVAIPKHKGLRKNLVRASRLPQLEQAVEPSQENVETELDRLDVDNWHTRFDDLGDQDFLDENARPIGKVVRYDAERKELHVAVETPTEVLQRGCFLVKNSVKEMLLNKQERALEVLKRSEATRPDLFELIAAQAAHRMGENRYSDLLQKNLSPEQELKLLVNRILANETIFCLQGPPGTGKTTMIAEVVAQILKLEPNWRILVCSQANEAVANAIEKIREVTDLTEVREAIGHDALIVRDVRDERAKIEGPWAGYEAAYGEFRDRLIEGTHADSAEPKERHAIEDWREALRYRSGNIERDHRELVQVWGTTAARAEQPLRQLEDAHYDLVIVDEAAKATVGEILVPLIHARRILLVGDHKQLPPFLEETTREALEQLGCPTELQKYSLFEHLWSILPEAHKHTLETQFRMHPTIGSLVSELFYEGKVQNGKKSDEFPLPSGQFDRDERVMWIDVTGREVRDRTSRANDAECQTIEGLLHKLNQDNTRDNREALSVAVISPYAAQQRLLEQRLKRRMRSWEGLDIKVGTVDSFQGREADVVFLSLVRTGSAEHRFVADARRFNVALSRAKRLLVIVGDRSGGRGTENLAKILNRIPSENQINGKEFLNR
jgi:serine/threonine protein kinase